MSRSILPLAAFVAALVALPAQSQASRSAPGRPADPVAHAASARAGGTTFVVTTAAASGPGSLRQALADARTAPGPHRVEFDIDGGGSYQEIFLEDFPALITETLVIDGDTQGCADRDVGPCIRIDGAGITPSPDIINGGLDVVADDVEIRNLVLTGFFRGGDLPGAAIVVRSSDVVVTGCRIGTDRTGLVTDPDGTPGTGDELGNGTGILGGFVTGLPMQTNLVIGGDDPAEANVVSGNETSGIATEISGSRVIGNFVGVGSDGRTPLGNGFHGIEVDGPEDGDDPTSADDSEIRGNVVSGNGETGIPLFDGVRNVAVVDNRIGTDADGLVAIPNGSPIPTGIPRTGTGIYLDAVEARVEGNVIGGNTAFGIQVGFVTQGDGGPRTISGNVISGNFVGVGSDLATPLPNGTAGNPNTGVGIVLLSGPSRVVTGNTIEGNVVAANTRGGVGGLGPDVFGNVIVGNLVGLAGDFATPLPNGGAQGVGIGFDEGARDNVVGATSFDDAEAGNVVGPHAAPIALLPNAGTGNAVGLNVLFRPTASPLPAIDLGLDGPTSNDAGDGDEGPNRRQNAPEILSTSDNGDGTLAVTVRVDSDPANAAYPLTVVVYGRQSLPGVELYAPLGVVEVPEASAGQPVTATLALDPEFAFDRVTATATDADGNTSELPLAAVAVAGEAAPAAGPALALAGPNPFGTATALRLTVDREQAVRAEVFDASGRRVAVLHDGPAGPGAPLALVVDGSALAAGVYVVRVTGEGWQTSRRVVVAR